MGELEDLEEAVEGRPKVKRTLSDQGGKRRITGAKPRLARDPPEPPLPPPRQRDASSSSKQTSRDYFTSLVKWLVSPASDVSRVTKTVSVWPAKANRAEPGDELLDEAMANVLQILEVANYHGAPQQADIDGSSDKGGPCKPLLSLGYSVVLCLHQHRNARAISSRAGQIRQRYFLRH